MNWGNNKQAHICKFSFCWLKIKFMGIRKRERKSTRKCNNLEDAGIERWDFSRLKTQDEFRFPSGRHFYFLSISLIQNPDADHYSHLLGQKACL